MVKWELEIGDWGLGIGYWAKSPIPNPQSPIPNPQSPIPNPQSPIPHPPRNLFQISLFKFINLQSINLMNDVVNNSVEEKLPLNDLDLSHLIFVKNPNNELALGIKIKI